MAATNLQVDRGWGYGRGSCGRPEAGLAKERGLGCRRIGTMPTGWHENVPNGEHCLRSLIVFIGIDRRVLESRVLFSVATYRSDYANSDRHDPDPLLPALSRRDRVPANDRPQGRSIRMPRLCPHGATRSPRIHMHLPSVLEDRAGMSLSIPVPPQLVTT